MVPLIKSLVAALREELEQYGEMLARLDDQQELVMRREADGVLQSVEAVQVQSLVIRRAREERERRQIDLAGSSGLSASADFSELIPRLPSDYGMLVSALVQENNNLLVRVQQRARQNHMLLAQSLELMGRMMKSLFPGSDLRTYNAGGTATAGGPSAFSLYEAVG